MVRGDVSAVGTKRLAVLAGRQNSKCYTNTLESFLLPSMEEKIGARHFYQQHNSAIHASNHSKKWLSAINIKLFDWLERSLNLNPIGNLCVVLARRIYDCGRDFDTRDDFMRTITKFWDELPRSLLFYLVELLPRRLTKTLEMRGSHELLGSLWH